MRKMKNEKGQKFMYNKTGGNADETDVVRT